jgi:hypothetical protein
MAQETPDEKIGIPDSCSSIKIIIEAVSEPSLYAVILRHSLKFLFNGETQVEVRQAEGKDYENCYIEIKKGPQIPLTKVEKEFLGKIYGKVGYKISFVK